MTTATVFEHEMLREIYQQPKALADTIERYAPNGKLATDVFQPVADALGSRSRLVIAASGSSRHAGLAAEIMLEDLAGLMVDVEYASEYVYRSPTPFRIRGFSSSLNRARPPIRWRGCEK